MHASILIFVVSAASSANAYWLMGVPFLTEQRLDPLVNPGKVSGHVHSVLGGSNFGLETDTDKLRNSECTSTPIPQDKSNYWFPKLYFQWKNGSFSAVSGGSVIYYLFSDDSGKTTAFPDNLRMLTGDPTKRTYDASSYAQQAVSFLCLNFNGKTTRHEGLPAESCNDGVRSQINFPSCWDNKNTDSADHKSHVAFPSDGPDKGACNDPKYPVTLPRIFIETYWGTQDFKDHFGEAMNPQQPFVLSYGDPTGYGYHADFINGWDKGVLQRAVDQCHCNIYGDPKCCADQGIFDLKPSTCKITNTVDEQVHGTLAKLPGNNPVQPAGKAATMFRDSSTPALLSPVYVYYGDKPDKVGSVVQPGSSGSGDSTSAPSNGASNGSNPNPTSAPNSAPSGAPNNGSNPNPTSVPNSTPSGTPNNGSNPNPTSAPDSIPSGAPNDGKNQSDAMPPPVSASGNNGSNSGSGSAPSSGSPSAPTHAGGSHSAPSSGSDHASGGGKGHGHGSKQCHKSKHSSRVVHAQTNTHKQSMRRARFGQASSHF